MEHMKNAYGYNYAIRDEKYKIEKKNLDNSSFLKWLFFLPISYLQLCFALLRHILSQIAQLYQNQPFPANVATWTALSKLRRVCMPNDNMPREYSSSTENWFRGNWDMLLS